MLVVFGGILLIVAAFFFANQGGDGGTPAIAVDQQRINYGDVKFNVEKTLTIKITNTGDGILRFKEEPYFGVHLKTNDPANPDLVVNVLSNWIP